MSQLIVRNRQRARSVDLPRLRRATRALLEDLLSVRRYELSVHLVTARKIAELNESFLQHEGSTDVITFDYAESEGRAAVPAPDPSFSPESIGIIHAPQAGGRGEGARWSGPFKAPMHPQKMQSALLESQQFPAPNQSGDSPPWLHGEIFISLDDAFVQARRFRTTWQQELVRYLVHGILHLCGYNDATGTARRRMKREEDRLLRALGRRFALSKLARKPTVQS
jgi:rRNA maturation RNase YbeY